jgi:hypothetical protein
MADRHADAVVGDRTAGRHVRGAPYGATRSLIGWALDNWGEFDGALTLRGVDVLALDAGRFVDVIYAFLIDGADTKERDKLDQQLDQAVWAHDADVARAEAERAEAGQTTLRTKSPPSWWKGDAEAEQTTFVLGARIQAVKPRA